MYHGLKGVELEKWCNSRYELSTCMVLILVIGPLEGESEGNSIAAFHGGLNSHLTSISDGSRIIV